MHEISKKCIGEMVTLYESGESLASIHRKTGHAVQTIRKYIRAESALRLPKRYQAVDLFTEPNSIEAYWLGFIAADGHLRPATSNRSGCLYIEVSSRDEQHLDKLRDYIGFGSKCIRYRNVIPTIIYQYYNDALVANISNFVHVGNKTNLDNFTRIPNFQKFNFIRGLFDGDGHKHSSGGIKFTGCSGTLDPVVEYISKTLEICPSRKIKNGVMAYDYWYIKRDAKILLDRINGELRLDRKWD